MEMTRLLLASIVLGAAFVVAGAKMAPKARVKTAFLLGLSGRFLGSTLSTSGSVVPHRDGLLSTSEPSSRLCRLRVGLGSSPTRGRGRFARPADRMT